MLCAQSSRFARLLIGSPRTQVAGLQQENGFLRGQNGPSRDKCVAGTVERSTGRVRPLPQSRGREAKPGIAASLSAEVTAADLEVCMMTAATDVVVEFLAQSCYACTTRLGRLQP